MPNRYRIDGATNITGSLTITGSVIATSFSGSFSGSGADLSGIPASSITGLNLSQIATGSITAAVNVNSASFAITSGSSTFLFVSSSGRVGIGTTSPSYILDILGTGALNAYIKSSTNTGASAWTAQNDANEIAQFGMWGSTRTAYGAISSGNSFLYSGTDLAIAPIGAIKFGNGTPPNERGRIFASTGNWFIGSSPTDAGFRLDVSGSGRFTDNLTVTGSAIISSSNATQMRVGSNLLFVSSSGRVGIGTTSPTVALDVNGAINSNSSITADFNSGLYLGSGVLEIKRVTSPLLGVQFLAPSYPMGFGFKKTYIGVASDTGLRSNMYLYSTIQLSGSSTIHSELDINPSISDYIAASPGALLRGIYIRPTLSTAAAGSFRAIEWNNNSGFGLYGSGSVQNILRGNLHIGSFVTASNTLSVAGTTRISGSFNTAASGSILTVIGSGSAQPIFTVQGSQGELFSVVDSLSGSLFSVNDISGLPIMEVFSDNSIVMGNYLDPMLITTVFTGSVAAGSHILYRLPTSSYDGFWFEYTVRSGSNARVGQIMGMWSGSSVNYLETSASAFGTTTDLNFMSTVSSGNMIISASTATAGWTIKGIVRSI